MMFKPAYFPFCFMLAWPSSGNMKNLIPCVWTTFSLNITKDFKPISVIYKGYYQVALN